MNNVKAYEEYLKKKILKAKPAGFEPVSAIHPIMPSQLEKAKARFRTWRTMDEGA